jgi:hypothetical protein
MRDVTVDFCRKSLVCLEQACQELTKTCNPELVIQQESIKDLTLFWKRKCPG